MLRLKCNILIQIRIVLPLCKGWDVWYSQIKFTDPSELLHHFRVPWPNGRRKIKFEEKFSQDFQILSHVFVAEGGWNLFIMFYLVHQGFLQILAHKCGDTGFLWVMIHFHLLLCPFSFGRIDFLSPYNLTCHYSWLQELTLSSLCTFFMGQTPPLNNWNAH